MRVTTAVREKLRIAARSAIAARFEGRYAAIQELEKLRLLINPEIAIDLLDEGCMSAELIEDRIRAHAKTVDDAIAIARAVAREKGSIR